MKKKTHDEFVKQVMECSNNEYEVLENYVNDKTLILMKHNKCRFEYRVTPNHFLRGDRCPLCSNKTNKIVIDDGFTIFKKDGLKDNLDYYRAIVDGYGEVILHIEKINELIRNRT